MKTTGKMLVGERAFCLALLLASLFILVQAYAIAGLSSISSPGAFPLGISLILVVSATRVLFALRHKQPAACGGWLDTLRQFCHLHFPRRVLVFILLATVYLAAIQWASFYVSTFVFLLLSIAYLRNGRLMGALLTSVLSVLLIYLLFTLAFSVYLP
ncbi:tripartite tricarboxylate transporter TctB family protein [Phytopseudomonas daroniae]|uniref:tripartite tricarboxylate transporter TctB family protein n=1 Tax=Phytopseudomonas daroniae TaxID=2487519 RepID=UPI001038386A|nr:tripartite tricarboxylate transporter TctB family protein [Pseudomonas daroniae]TBU74513.1 tripartite tricarboxylate transporter TctB family protein [Pseudomonas daroniae]